MSEFVEGPPFFDAMRANGFIRRDAMPWLLHRDGAAELAMTDDKVKSEWTKKQAQFIRWTQDKTMSNAADVAQNYAIYDSWFRDGPNRYLRGRVLDIGGGWGLFREWWDAAADGCFVVHDPGVERFTTPPPNSIEQRFATGLRRPAWFVEGFGEDLPYRDATYDTVAIISALDHCARPDRVLAEAARVLRADGRLFVIQGFDSPSDVKMPGRSFAARLGRLLADPRRLHRAIRQRLFHRGDPHMSHFSLEELGAMLSRVGFSDIRNTVVSRRFGVAVIEARKLA